MTSAQVIIEMDIERDRKACIQLDLKVTGANRELAQWLMDHPRYPATVAASWLGCGDTRIKQLRRWAEFGFSDDRHPTVDRRRYADHRRRAADPPLESLDNPEEGEIEEVADPAGFIVAVAQNATDKANIAVRNIERDFTDDDRAKIVQAIDALIRKWTSVKRKVHRRDYG